LPWFAAGVPRLCKDTMDQHTQAIDVMGALRTQSDDETIEIRILRPHEAYRRSLAACAPEAADPPAAKVDEP